MARVLHSLRNLRKAYWAEVVVVVCQSSLGSLDSSNKACAGHQLGFQSLRDSTSPLIFEQNLEKTLSLDPYFIIDPGRK